MDRAQRLAILNAASDDSLAMALSAIGIESGGVDDDPYGEGQENPVPVWGNLDVSIPETKRGPLISKESLFVPKPAPRPTNPYGMPMPGQEDDDLFASGMLG